MWTWINDSDSQVKACITMVPMIMFFVFLTSLQGATTEANGTILMSSREEKFRQLFDSVANKDQPEIYRKREVLIHEVDREREAFDAVKMLLQRKGSMKAENAMRYRRDQVTDSDSASGYVRCAPLTEDMAFQKVFRTEFILLHFLNELLHDMLPSELISVDISAEDQEMVESNEYGTKHDVHARDLDGNRYVIQMERACQPQDIIRFQFVSGKVFAQVINSRFNDLRAKAEEAAHNETQKAKDEAGRTAAENAKNEGKTSAEAKKAKQKAEKKVKPVNPKAIGGHHKLFHPAEVPTVLVIVIAEDGLPMDHMSVKFTRKNQYILFESYSKLGSLSKKNFVFIDLKRFASTRLLNKPKTELDRWCVLLWKSKERKIEKKVVDELRKVPAISSAVDMMAKMAKRAELERVYQANRDETLRDEGRLELRSKIVRGMLERKVADAEIMETVQITEDELKKLKSTLA